MWRCPGRGAELPRALTAFGPETDSPRRVHRGTDVRGETVRHLIKLEFVHLCRCVLAAGAPSRSRRVAASSAFHLEEGTAGEFVEPIRRLYPWSLLSARLKEAAGFVQWFSEHTASKRRARRRAVSARTTRPHASPSVAEWRVFCEGDEAFNLKHSNPARVPQRVTANSRRPTLFKSALSIPRIISFAAVAKESFFRLGSNLPLFFSQTAIRA